MKAPTPVPGVSVQAGGGAGIGGVLAIGAGAFLILLAYTGKLQDVWAAAFGNPLQTVDNAITGGTHGENKDGDLSPDDSLAGGGNCTIPRDYVNSGDAVFGLCSNGKCPAGSFTVVNTNTGRMACCTDAHYDAAKVLGWTKATERLGKKPADKKPADKKPTDKKPAAVGAGQAFTHVTAWPMGGWHTGVSPSARPAASWGFDA